MPIYEFVCKSCNSRFESLQRTMSGDAKAKCPECGSTKTDKALSVFAVAGESSAKSSASQGPQGPMCGCGKVPGSCGME